MLSITSTMSRNPVDKDWEQGFWLLLTSPLASPSSDSEEESATRDAGRDRPWCGVADGVLVSSSLSAPGTLKEAGEEGAEVKWDFSRKTSHNDITLACVLFVLAAKQLESSRRAAHRSKNTLQIKTPYYMQAGAKCVH